VSDWWVTSEDTVAYRKHPHSRMYCVQGVYRGLGDTRTPLWGTLACNAINVILAPLLIFSADWGCRGAALATVTSQVIASSLAPRMNQYLHLQALAVDLHKETES
jgi:hypothetical protein